MKRRDARTSPLYRLKWISERLHQPGLSDFEKVVLKGHYADLVERSGKRPSTKELFPLHGT